MDTKKKRSKVRSSQILDPGYEVPSIGRDEIGNDKSVLLHVGIAATLVCTVFGAPLLVHLLDHLITNFILNNL